jgi:hypothetical protein
MPYRWRDIMDLDWSRDERKRGYTPFGAGTREKEDTPLANVEIVLK